MNGWGEDEKRKEKSASTWLLSANSRHLVAPKLHCQKILWASVSESNNSSAPDDIRGILSRAKGWLKEGADAFFHH
ncbi:hypothetical protein KOW79_018113 [Hemibagrus wyckioides]|uniref:Uncharacterized protein n=1 Tax=Hemibagrus wyckioides TaxID=337641 RepID=A0A9D3NBP4_9TELE|nr:hypothetical protein KOW79_018113 [Hemibagrus wyckioides]